MIDMQLLSGVLLAVALLVGAAIVVAAGMVAVATTRKPGRGRGPHGGTRRDPAPLPQPDTDDARELVLR